MDVTEGSSQFSKDVKVFRAYLESFIQHISDEESENALNSVDSLRKGEVKTTAQNREFTILLVGETGTGKTTFVSFLHNVLTSKPLDAYADGHDLTNEAGGSQKGSQTQHPFLYRLVSCNGVVFRIIDTPGLADTGGVDKDNAHREEIGILIRDHVERLDAISLLANGTIPRLGVSTEYVFNVLATIFPRSIADNIGVIFTNVASEMSLNIDFSSLPAQIHSDRYFCLDNPLALQKSLQVVERRGENARMLKLLRNDIKARETMALGVLARILDWLDSATPQPTTAIVELFEKTRKIEAALHKAHTSMLASRDMQHELERIQATIENNTRTTDLYKGYRTIVTKSRMGLVSANDNSIYCVEPGCFTNCSHSSGPNPFRLTMPKGSSAYETADNFLRFRFIICKVCKHYLLDHQLGHEHWQELYSAETRTDEEAKKMYETATSDTEGRRIMHEAIEQRLSEIQDDIAAATQNVSVLADEYASLSLSGSFAGQIHKTIKFLNVHLEISRNRGAPLARIQQTEQSIAALERKLAVLEGSCAQARGKVAVQGVSPSTYINTAEGGGSSAKGGLPQVSKVADQANIPSIMS